MKDKRLLASNGVVAASELAGLVDAERYCEGVWRQCSDPVANLHDCLDGPLSCQLLYGWRFRVLEEKSGWAFGQSERDGYVGYVKLDALSDCSIRTHWVGNRSTHIFPEPDIKSVPKAWLPYGARIAARTAGHGFKEVPGIGFIPERHCCDHCSRPDCAVAEAQKFLGTPYLWGGNSPLGIDCSGLVQLAFEAVGVSCPRDSDQQQADLGTQLEGGLPKTGDLVFWTGHVGIISDDNTLLHANAHAMSVVEEPLDLALKRISAECGFRGYKRVKKFTTEDKKTLSGSDSKGS